MSEELYDGLLEPIPPDPAMAKNYVELLALLKEQRKLAERGVRQSADDFWARDQKVQSMLTARERSFLLEPNLLPAGQQDPDIPRANRLNHLIKILVHRQGLKTTNGLSG
ncbi:hypothetical protein [Bradyrhizobium sp. USDA 3315]